jgi:hypothetical protein
LQQTLHFHSEVFEDIALSQWILMYVYLDYSQEFSVSSHRLVQESHLTALRSIPEDFKNPAKTLNQETILVFN